MKKLHLKIPWIFNNISWSKHLSVIGLILIGLFLISAQSNAQKIDLAFVLDGSGSIDAKDFEIQKKGLMSALRRSDIFPRNGEIAFTLVQYAGEETRVEVPYTVLTSEGVVLSIINLIRDIEQIKGGTNPGDGVNTAMQILNASGNPNHKQVLCLSTDGIPNAGADIATALSNARNSGIKLDRFNVLAIEDPVRDVYEQDFIDYYDPLLFGDGGITVSKLSVEFANMVGATCLFAELSLRALEVNQAVQDWNNSVSLTKNKPTMVRAFIESMGNNPAPATARLRGYRGGVELPNSPLTATNAYSFRAPVYTTLETVIEARRANLSSSLNFKLPQNWLNGNVTIKLEGVGGPMDCSSTPSVDSNCRINTAYFPIDLLKVKFLKVAWRKSRKKKYKTKDYHIDYLEQRLLSIFPIDRMSAGRGKLKIFKKNPSRKKILRVISRRRIFSLGWLGNRIYYGALVLPDGDMTIEGRAFVGKKCSYGKFPTTPFWRGHNTHAHEIAHNFGIEHAPYCIEDEDPATSSSPFPKSHVSYDLASIPVATIGPLRNGIDNQIWGYDNYSGKIINPRKNFELMSYCAFDIQENWNWISDFTYNRVRSAIDIQYRIDMQEGIGQNYAIVSGQIDTLSGVSRLDPVIYFSSTAQPPVEIEGEYILELLDNENNILSSTPFEPDFSEENDAEAGIGNFVIPVLTNPAMKSVRISKNDNVIIEYSASPNTPTVEVLYPNGGEVLTDSLVNIVWTASDPDGDSLTYTVEYSRDGGNNWEALTLDWEGDTLDMDLIDLEETTQGLIRVTASDGFNSSSDISDFTFSTPNNMPRAEITGIKDGDRYAGVQPIYFEAFSYDNEDGRLSDGNFSWSSDIDGPLGTGEFMKIASDFTEGEHIITLTATDNGSLSYSTSVKVFISRLPNIPPLISIESPEDGKVYDYLTKLNIDVFASEVESNDAISKIDIVLNGDTITTLTAEPYTYSYTPVPGEYIIEAIAYDNNGGTASDKVTITINEPMTKTISIPIVSGSDDIEEQVSTGYIKMTSGDLDMSYDDDYNNPNGAYQVGLRFQDIKIPGGSAITNAHIQFTVDEPFGGVSKLQIKGEAVDNASAFSSGSRNLSRRIMTNTESEWTPEEWTTANESGPNQRTSDISEVLQKIIDRPGWQSGNAMVLSILGEGIRTAESYEGLPENPPTLTITYIPAEFLTDEAVQVTNGSDDIEQEETSGIVNMTSGDLDMSDDEDDDKDRLITGIRFNNVSVPQGAVITNTQILFTADEVTRGEVELNVECEASGNALPFTEDDYNLSNRPKVNTSVVWQPNDWLNIGESGHKQLSSNLNVLLQELVKRPDWQNGNSVVFSILGDGIRTAESYEGSPFESPRLYITYINEQANQNPVQPKNEYEINTKVYPNPTNGQVIIEYDVPDLSDTNQSGRINIYNSLGQLVFNESFDADQNNRRNFDLKALPVGTYYLRIQIGMYYSNKVIVKVD